MSLIIKNEDSCQYMPIIDPYWRDNWEVRSLDLIPQQVRDSPSQFKINVLDGTCYCVVNHMLRGVALRDLWVFIDGRALSLYAEITEGEQENAVHCHPKKSLGWIKGEATLPIRIYQKPERACFGGYGLCLIFSKEVGEFLEQMIII